MAKRAQGWELGERVLWDCYLFSQHPVDQWAGPLPHSAGKAITGQVQIQGEELHFTSLLDGRSAKEIIAIFSPQTASK